jgi:ribosomal protein S18 acetylase RimI-like enzyme
MAFVIRPARPADAEAIAAVNVAARRRAMPYLRLVHGHEETVAWVRDVLLDRDEVHVAEADGRVVAFLGLYGPVLEQLWVEPQAQGRGVGSALLDLAKDLRPQGFDLWVFQRNDQARGFYERRGLLLAELTDGAGNDEREPDARYAWRPGDGDGRRRSEPS